MTTINLLPWRERERQERQRHFLIGASLSAVLALLLMLMTHLYYVNKIEAQRARNMLLQAEISVLDRKIYRIAEIEKDKAQLKQRMAIVQDLQRDRLCVVHLFDEIYRMLPTGMYYTRIERTGNALVFQGTAQSNTDISTLMRNMEASAWLSTPVLQHSKSVQVGDRVDYNFDVRCQIKAPTDQLGVPV